MKSGDPIYRVVRLHDGKWYFCVYEFVRVSISQVHGCGWVEVAPVLTYYEAKHSSHSTFTLHNYTSDCIAEWVRDWDYLSSDEQLALAVYKEKTKDENQSNNKTFPSSRDRD